MVLNRSSNCPACGVRCIKVNRIFLSSINEIVDILRNILCVPECRGDLPSVMPKRIIQRRATVCIGASIHSNKVKHAERNVTSTNLRPKRQRNAVSRLAYIVCDVCKRTKSTQTSSPLSSYIESYVCSIRCLKLRKT